MTIEQNYFELIQATIDGEIDSADKEMLDAFLEESAGNCWRFASHWTACHRSIPRRISDTH
jgi:anti-sigma factor RsiW